MWLKIVLPNENYYPAVIRTSNTWFESQANEPRYHYTTLLQYTTMYLLITMYIMFVTFLPTSYYVNDQEDDDDEKQDTTTGSSADIQAWKHGIKNLNHEN